MYFREVKPERYRIASIYEEQSMKRSTPIVLSLAALCFLLPLALRAQDSNANPVTTSVKEIFDRQADRISKAVDEMPGDKYSYHPTAEQWTFSKIVSHVAQSDFAVCAMISGSPAPDDYKVTPTDPKEKLAPAIKASFDFCSQALMNLKDSQMGDPITFFGGRKTTRARAAIELVSDLIDHYSQLASYLRLNGMLPPSASPAKPSN
jgi:uncharacterized damage-inducible protein DinB